MIRSKIVALLISLIIIPLISEAQQQVIGRILEESTLSPIPFAHIRTDSIGTISNKEGWFQIIADSKDTIWVSHVNYVQKPLTLVHTNDTLTVYLTPAITKLNEVIISQFPSEEKLKSELIKHDVPMSQEEYSAKQNMKLATMIYLSGYTPKMTSWDNYNEFIRGPQGVSIFSSDPSKGLFKSIRNLSKKNYFHYNTQIKLDSTLSLFKLRKPLDTLK
ncbi:MAG: hypothetical protein CMP48_19265 [Rickettsiales bacterium]|nr:hypothetical protein [Rickettsiales bacterium]